MIAFWLLAGLFIYAMVRLALGAMGKNNTGRCPNDAIEILNQRFAKGEISEEEYTQKKKMLRD